MSGQVEPRAEVEYVKEQKLLDQIPVVARVNVLVLGGSSGAAACALAACRDGARVFLAAPRAYIGDDIAADFDYWLRDGDERSTPLAKAVFPSGGVGAAASPPTPMHVKRTLEQALATADLSFVLNVHPAGVVRDKAGRLAGVVLANRAGRQIVLADEIVDATERSLVARQAGLTFSSPPAGMLDVAYVTVGGDTATGEGLTSESLPAMTAKTGDDDTSLPARRYRVQVDAGDGSWEALAAAQAEVVQRCWTPGVFQQSERLTTCWPDHVVKGAGGARDHERAGLKWTEAALFPLEALQAEPGLHLLSTGADVSRDVAASLTRPTHLMAVGDRLGAKLAKGAAASSSTLVDSAAVEGLVASCAGSETIAAGQIVTPLQGLRPIDHVNAFVPAEANTLPRLGRFDVVVIGGGTGGAGAGIAAGRAGASTLVCESMPILGGVGTAGQIARYWFGNTVGFTHEMDDGVTELEVADHLKKDRVSWSPSAKQTWQHRESKRAGVSMWFGVIACGAWREGDRVRGVVVAGPHGYGLVKAGAIVDATGSADIAAAAGAPVKVIGADHVAVQGVGLGGIQPAAPYRNTDHNFSDDTDPVDATAFLVSSKRKFKDDFDCGQLVDSRERRQIIGDLELTPADYMADRRFPDTICVSSSNFDTHGYTIHPLFLVKPPGKDRLWVDVPYRCLLPAGIDGVLVTGLGVSAHRDALPVIRMQADVQNQGYAAGLAAAMAAKADLGVREIDIKTLQRRLIEIGNLPDRVLTDAEQAHFDDARLDQAVATGWDSFEGLAILFAETERALPRLRDAFAACPSAGDGDDAESKAKRLRYSLVMALMNDATGAGVLAEEIASRSWDEGWNYRGMGQFGMSASELDAFIMALGLCGDASAWDVVLDKIEQLPADPAFSHCRAVVEACEHLHARHPDDRAAAALASVLTKPDMTGHAQTSLADVQEHITDNGTETLVRNVALRELHLARGLYRCGDKDTSGETTLRQYARDMRGHFARHAAAVLREAGGASDQNRAKQFEKREVTA